MKQFLIKNYKTTVPGVVLAMVGFLTATHRITTEAGTMIAGVLGAIGLAGAKDADKTGDGK
jgi:hypothetical protein